MPQILYPPLVDTYMPAFINTDSCRIYFSITSFNNIASIGHVQLTVRYLDNNQSALNPNLWKSEIKVCPKNYDSVTVGIPDEYRNYITLDPNDMNGGAFSIGQTYQAQLRFSGSELANPSFTVDPGLTWFNSNSSYFSEWSRPCLLKATSDPTITLINVDAGTGVFTGVDAGYGIMTFVGRYINTDITEPLKSLTMQLYAADGAALLEVSSLIYPDTIYLNTGSSRADFHYRFNTALINGTSYKIKIIATTFNGLVDTSVLINVVATISAATLAGLTMVPTIDNDNGYLSLNVTTSISASGDLLIRRSDHYSNFTHWEDVHLEKAVTGLLNKTFIDYTAESGVLYKYWVSGNTLASPVMLDYDSIFLLGPNNQQLKIDLNPNLSSFKYTVSDTKVETLGSKYPFIRRNGDMYYKEGSIAGLISVESDENHLFMSNSTLYDGFDSAYAAYNTSNNIAPHRDFIKEKKYRDKVLSFLYDGKVKLYKSNTEGNILVRLLDISLTPDVSLGRLIFSFSATITEVDDYNISNCIKYNLLKV